LAFGISGGATLIAAVALILASHAGWSILGYTLAITWCVQIFMFLPSLLFHPSAPKAVSPPLANEA